jgi:phosphoribosylamine--glycine ligase|tara:strand:- start:2350 stop:3645 length:1296 start_codon:yes stop_codon:yes gene_type:complete
MKHNSINVLILGSGGREHAIAWKIKQSPFLNKIFVAPGNSGTSNIATNINININNYNSIKNTILEHEIHIVIVGPEDPLVHGLHNMCKNDTDISNVTIIGPQKEGALLEGSKSFAKKFMQKNKIPTAKYEKFEAKNIRPAKSYLKKMPPPYVIKVDGLAAGKGVFICEDIKEANRVLEDLSVSSRFGEAGETIVIEEFLKGIEMSVFILTNGNSYKILPVAKDYKRIGENDTGLNTGGMGAVSPVPFMNQELLKKVETKIIQPTIKGLKKENISYIGFIFFGLINVEGEPYVIEYNVRLGDPETQVILPRIESDLLELFINIEKNSIFKNIPIKISELNAATIILSSGGYPEKYSKGHIVTGCDDVTESILFHAGLKAENNKHLTNGGRVLAVTSLHKKAKIAIQKCYSSIEKIHFKNVYFRRDIGKDIIK